MYLKIYVLIKIVALYIKENIFFVSVEELSKGIGLYNGEIKDNVLNCKYN